MLAHLPCRLSARMEGRKHRTANLPVQESGISTDVNTVQQCFTDKNRYVRTKGESSVHLEDLVEKRLDVPKSTAKAQVPSRMRRCNIGICPQPAFNE